jgi:predicted RNase H-like HicB family nuclease
MTFPVLVQPANGQFAATLVGAPDVRATAPTRAEALAALETAIEQRVAQGDLVALEIGRRGVSRLAGKYRDDPTLREICEEAYRQRDSGPVE